MLYPLCDRCKSLEIGAMLNSQENFAGLYILEKSKGPEMGKEIKEGKKKEKKEIWGKYNF